MSKSTSLPSNLVSTAAIVASAKYAAGPSAFFSQFGSAWAEARSQVIKLETRQTYRQAGNPSYDAMVAGDLKRAIELIPASVADDKELYASLRQRRVDFVRCRPVAYPLSAYLHWELHHYEMNAKEGERIFCCDAEENEALFSRHATHDFMVFDDTVAFIHDYDASGTIQGGWSTTDVDHISELQQVFCWIRSRSLPFDLIQR